MPPAINTLKERSVSPLIKDFIVETKNYILVFANGSLQARIPKTIRDKMTEIAQ